MDTSLPLTTDVKFRLVPKKVHSLLDDHQMERLKLSPGFQRQSVWKDGDRKKLIESILRGYPLPAIFLHKTTDQDGNTIYNVIDGKQRIESLLMFTGAMRGKRYAVKTNLPGETEVQVLDWTRLNKLRRQSLIADYDLSVIEVEGDLSDMLKLFVSINSLGKPLSAQEKRHAKYFDNAFLKAVDQTARALEPTLKQHRILSAMQIERMKHIELIAELAYSSHKGDVTHKKAALDHVLSERTLTALQIKKAMDGTKSAIKQVLRILPEIATTRFHKLADFYTLVVLVMKFQRDGLILNDARRNQQAAELLKKFGNAVDTISESLRKVRSASYGDEGPAIYLRTVKEGTDSERNRRDREALLRELLEPVFQKKDADRAFSPEQRRLIWHSSEARICSICEAELGWSDFTIDHVFPHSRGGKTSIENAQLMCRSCNSAKGART